MPRSVAIAAGLVLLTLLAGCSRGEPAPEQRLVCPRPGIVAGLEQTEAYRPGGDGRDADLQWIAVMQNIGGGCSYEDGLTEQLTVDLVVETGPAFDGKPVDLRYFVAIAGPDGQLIDKQLFSTRVQVPTGMTRAVSRDSFSQLYPGIRPVDGAGYKVFLGFDLPEGEALRRHRLQPR